MKLKEIIEFLDDKIPESLALNTDEVGFKKDYDLNQDISLIKVYMDLFVEDDEYFENTLIITHHPPLFDPKTPTYTIHSNWDIICGGANDALAEALKLDVIDYLDCEINIGRICEADQKFTELKRNIFNDLEAVSLKCSKELRDLYNEIKELGIDVFVSGSGPTMYVVDPTMEEILKIKDVAKSDTYILLTNTF